MTEEEDIRAQLAALEGQPGEQPEQVVEEHLVVGSPFELAQLRAAVNSFSTAAATQFARDRGQQPQVDPVDPSWEVLLRVGANGEEDLVWCRVKEI